MDVTNWQLAASLVRTAPYRSFLVWPGSGKWTRWIQYRKSHLQEHL